MEVLHRRGSSNDGGGLCGGGRDMGRHLIGGGSGMRKAIRCCMEVGFLGESVRRLGLRLGRVGLRLGIGGAGRVPIGGGSPSIEGEKSGMRRGRRLKNSFRVFRGGNLRGFRRRNRGSETSLHGDDRSLVGERLRAVV
ncbi:hypothetical protein LIER_39937 [Lithospermum erythrorhizon]|uniref:Uncharacterized protein n=1 Tax=Lithospermum erythrorhizon TaxID=34254 RepID=A0AAV3QRH6_LITER